MKLEEGVWLVQSQRQAVILPNDFRNTELNDSKKLSESKRNDLKKIIIEKAIDYSIVHIPVQVIEKSQYFKCFNFSNEYSY
jgi:ribonuclease HII